jgi:hypothetical protein
MNIEIASETVLKKAGTIIVLINNAAKNPNHYGEFGMHDGVEPDISV